jgi:glutamate synthase (NADPH/NADH) large chain
MTERLTTGLYDPAFERDSCGFGLIANLDDNASHWVVDTAITALVRLTHRGAVAADGKTGDGCGLLLKSPVRFLRAIADECGFTLAERFAAGTVFLGQDESRADAVRRVIDRALADSELEVAGWRRVPVDPSVCGDQALATLPRIEQVFVNAPGGMQRTQFNRRLFLARRRAESRFSRIDPDAYVASLSSATISYKGMVMPEVLASFYPDLKDSRLETSVCLFHQRFSTNTLPQWRLAQPFRFLAHNGEINTIQGNRNWALARAQNFRSENLHDVSELDPIIATTGSDSSSLDNLL